MKIMQCIKCLSERDSQNEICSYTYTSSRIAGIWFCCECANDFKEFISEQEFYAVQKFIQPERNKQEDFQEHYLCWEIPIEGVKRQIKFFTYSKEDAQEWHKSEYNRSYDTHTFNKYRENRCSEHCGNKEDIRNYSDKETLGVHE